MHDVPKAERTYPNDMPVVEIGQDVSGQLGVAPMRCACCAAFANVMVAFQRSCTGYGAFAAAARAKEQCQR